VVNNSSCEIDFCTGGFNSQEKNLLKIAVFKTTGIPEWYPITSSVHAHPAKVPHLQFPRQGYWPLALEDVFPMTRFPHRKYVFLGGHS
jgi:hypothetical protein